MRCLLSPMRLRDRAISKFVAAWFVVLIGLPFTAPFQTLDLATPAQGAAQGSPSADKDFKEATMTETAVDPGTPLIGIGFCAVSPTYGDARPRPIEQTVLRL